MSKIEPALTGEEWARHRALRSGGGPLWALNQGYDNHQIAAVCLDSHPYGFTREHVDLTRVAAESSRCDGDALDDLADLIEALLPPERDG